MDETALEERIRQQEGVCSRRQMLECGGTDVDIERKLRRREWARIHQGVYVAHTGPLSWRQRAWAATLAHHPSALDGPSALAAHGVRQPGPADPIELVVPRGRRVDDLPGVHTRQVTGFDAVAHPGPGLPRVRLEHAALSCASAARTDDAAIAVLSDVCQQHRTTPARLIEVLTMRTRLPRRAFLLAVLDDVASGAYSALEHRYLRLERRHRLPTGTRQHRVAGGQTVAYRDVEYLDHHVVVELDGRLGHEAIPDRWADVNRDLAAAVSGTLTVRLGWHQVLDECRTAATIGALLGSRGWRAAPHACGPACGVTKWIRGGSPAPGAGEPPLSA